MRTACIAVLAAGTLVGLTATPAAAAPRPDRHARADDSGALSLRLRLGCPLCVDLGVLNTVHVRVHAGPGSCDRPAPPIPKPPSPKPPPKPPSPKPPPRPPRPAPPAPAGPPARSAPVQAAPHAAHRAVPPAAARRPTPPAASPSHRRAVPKAAAVPHRRKNPLATLMVLVVLTAVIAAGAGVAFAAAP
jgi:hypothetical protein